MYTTTNRHPCQKGYDQLPETFLYRLPFYIRLVTHKAAHTHKQRHVKRINIAKHDVVVKIYLCILNAVPQHHKKNKESFQVINVVESLFHHFFAFQTFIQLWGIGLSDSILSHFVGETTTFCGLRFSQAPHQEKEELAMMLCWQRLINCIST